MNTFKVLFEKNEKILIWMNITFYGIFVGFLCFNFTTHTLRIVQTGLVKVLEWFVNMTTCGVSRFQIKLNREGTKILHPYFVKGYILPWPVHKKRFFNHHTTSFLWEVKKRYFFGIIFKIHFIKSLALLSDSLTLYKNKDRFSI